MSFPLRLLQNEMERLATINRAEEVYSLNYAEIVRDFKRAFGIREKEKVTADMIRQMSHLATLVENSDAALAALKATFDANKSA